MSAAENLGRFRVKEAAGDITGNDALKSEGEANQPPGKARKAVGDVADMADMAVELIDKVKDAAHRD